MEGEAGHALAHALIQRQNRTKRIALGQISTQKAAICTSVKVDAFFLLNIFPEMITAYFDTLASSFLFIFLEGPSCKMTK